MKTAQLTLRIFALCCITGAFTLCSDQSFDRPTNDSGRQSGWPAIEMELDRPGGLAMSGADILYASTRINGRVYRLDLKTGLMTVLEAQAPISGISTLQSDQSGNLIAAIPVECRVIQLNVHDGAVRTIVGVQRDGVVKPGCGFAGDGGPALEASIEPDFFTQDVRGNLFIVDGFPKARIRRVEQKSGTITTVLGSSHLRVPITVAVNEHGTIFVSQLDGGSGDHPILSLDPVSNSLTALKKSSFIGNKDLWTKPRRTILIFSDRFGNLYVMDEARIFLIDMADHSVSLLAGTTKGFSGDGGPAIRAQLYWPGSLVLDSVGNIYVSDSENQRIRRIDAKTHIITTVAGNGRPSHSPGTIEVGE